MSAVAQNPLDRLDLWKDASDPWQFVQAAKAIRDWLVDPSRKLHVPVGFDQTCSGMGIIACLTRDRSWPSYNCINVERTSARSPRT